MPLKIRKLAESEPEIEVVGKIRNRRPISSYILETVQDRCIVTMER